MSHPGICSDPFSRTPRRCAARIFLCGRRVGGSGRQPASHTERTCEAPLALMSPEQLPALLRIEQAAQVEVVLTTGLLRPFRSRWMVGHRLYPDAARADEAVEDDRGASYQAADGAQETTAAL